VHTSFELEMNARVRHADLVGEAALARLAKQVQLSRDSMRPTWAVRLSTLMPELTRRFVSRMGITAQTCLAVAPRPRGVQLATCQSC
jgi:hypothetical protein